VIPSSEIPFLGRPLRKSAVKSWQTQKNRNSWGYYLASFFGKNQSKTDKDESNKSTEKPNDK
jgi:hypothetical protein